ncbi:hypothetical protein F4779DRAFT_623784 [Xylariaceae sp. FL0662B]|nr:hypothetical protein F4779DRAFT_623784 [Xylariaceae sp. FL0662B]
MKAEDSTVQTTAESSRGSGSGDGDDDEWSANASEGLLGSKEKPPKLWRRDEPWYAGRKAIRVHVVVFCIYLTIVIGLAVALGRAWKKLDRQFLYSPANDAIDWSIQEFNSGDGLTSDFGGHPRPELEKAWADLLGPMNIRLELQDVQAFGREKTAVPLSDGSGYVGSLNVYHELHCVRWLYKYIWQDEYFPDADEEQKKKNKSHSEHCLNALRKFAMCHGDPGMIIYSFMPWSLKPGANGTAHQCVDWPKLSKWANERAIDIYEPGLIVHPQLGPVYKEGGELNEIHVS